MQEEDLSDVMPEEVQAPEEDSIVDLVKAMFYAGVIALVIRSLLFEPFNIPSESMLPTLQVGDYLFVEKYAYGYSKYSFPMGVIDFDGRVWNSAPKRGDVAVFRQPKKPHIDYIKRIVGLPGDTIQVKYGVLQVNGKPVMRDLRNSETVKHDDDNGFLYKRYIETLPNGLQHYIYERADYAKFDNTPVYEVPKGYYFAMGDNRDSSLDSRAQEQVGFIPAENLVGRAWFLFFSVESIGDACKKEGTAATLRSFACKVVEYPQAIRWSRFFKVINEIDT